MTGVRNPQILQSCRFPKPFPIKKKKKVKCKINLLSCKIKLVTLYFQQYLRYINVTALMSHSDFSTIWSELQRFNNSNFSWADRVNLEF